VNIARGQSAGVSADWSAGVGFQWRRFCGALALAARFWRAKASQRQPNLINRRN